MTHLHDVSTKIRMRTGGVITLELSQATAVDVLEWLAPILAYLQTMAEEEAEKSAS